MTQWSNWAGNVTASPDRIVRPGSTDEVVALVTSCAKVKAVGAGHSFTPIAAPEGTQIRLDLPAHGSG